MTDGASTRRAQARALTLRRQARANTRRSNETRPLNQVGQEVVALRGQYPWLSPGLAVAVAQWKLDKRSEGFASRFLEEVPKLDGFDNATQHEDEEWLNGAIAVIAQRDYDAQEATAKKERESNRSWWEQNVFDKAKAVSTAAFTAFDTGAQVVENLYAAGNTGQQAMQAGMGMPNDGQFRPGGWLQAKTGVGGTITMPSETPELAEIFTETSGGQAIARTARGEDVDLGTGWFPGGTLQTDVDQSRINTFGAVEYNGKSHVITPGRGFAAAFTEPGSTEYGVASGIVDATVDWYMDPADRALDAAGIVNKARKTIVPDKVRDAAQAEAGMVKGTFRVGVEPKQASQFLDSNKFRPVAEDLAGIDDVLEIDRLTGGKLRPEAINKVRKASTYDEVLDVLRPEMGVHTTKVLPTGFGYTRRKVLPEMVTQLPSRTSLDFFGNGRKAFDSLHSYMQILDIDKADQSRVLASVLDAVDDQSSGKLYTALVGGDPLETSVAEVIEAGLIKQGVDKTIARTQSRLFRDGSRSQYALNESGNMREFSFVHGGEVTKSRTMLDSQMFNGVMTLPDVKAVKRTADQYKAIRGIAPEWSRNTPRNMTAWARAAQKTLYGLGDTLRWGTESIWIPLQLLRGQWPLKVVGEEQVRLAAAGYNSMFSHPIEYMATVIGMKHGIRNRGITGEVLLDSRNPQLMDSVLRDGLATSRRTVADYETIGYGALGRDDNGFVAGWHNELAEMASSAVGREIARADINGTLLELKGDFFDGKLRPIRDKLMENAQYKADLATREGADAYIDDVTEWFHQLTRKDPELAELVAYSHTRGTDASLDVGAAIDEGRAPFDLWASKGARGASPELDAKLRGMLDVKDTPEKVLGQISVPRQGAKRGRAVVDQTTNRMFDLLATMPTNMLTRSPLLQQVYWDRVQALVPYMSKGDQAAILKLATDDGLAKDAIERLRTATASSSKTNLTGGTVGHLALGDVDDVAKAFAVTRVEELLFDLSSKNRFWDAMKVVFPFGEAWQEVITRWARIIGENPNVVRRGQQFWQAAHSPDLAFLPWMPGYNGGQGFFYQDPTTGEEMFVDPGASLLNQAFTGLPIPAVSRVSGLNIIGGAMPGVGPATQYPAQIILDAWADDEKWDPIREMVLPFGDRDMSSAGAIVDEMMPTWARKLTTLIGASPDPTSTEFGSRQYANTVKDVMAALISQRQLENVTPDQLNALEKEAEQKSRYLWAIGAVGSFGLTLNPTTSNPRAYAQEPGTDKLIELDVLKDEYNALRRTYGNDMAMQVFLARHGTANFFATGSYSESDVFEIPMTASGLDWVRKNGDLVDRYEDVYGFFAPDDGEFSLAAWMRASESGDLKAVQTDDWVKASNRALATNAFNHAKRVLGEKADTPEGREWLRKYRLQLAADYTGFDTKEVDVERNDRGERQLREAMVDPKLDNTRQAQALRKWFKVVDAFEDQSLAVDDNNSRDWWRTATKDPRARKMREFLRDYANKLTSEYGEFGRTYDMFLSRTFRDDIDADARSVEQLMESDR